ncbi:MAG: sugar ABC transporter substrate-binding protein [Rectinemataceae bacterium]|jgi:ribose transport system substrate-binding protein
MKKIAAILLALVMLLCATGMVFGQAAKITIAYTGYPGGGTPFWAQMTQYVKEAAAAEGVKLIDLSPTVADAAQQKDSVDNAINQGVKGIIIGAIDNRAFGESLKRAAAKKIVCVAVDTAIDDPQITALCQTDNLASARVMGQYMVDHLATKGKVLILGGTLGHQTGDARRDGVRQVLEANGFEVIFRACDWDDAKALETATNELQANSDIVAIFGCWDPGALAGLAAVKQGGLLDQVKVFGFDGLPAAFKSIKDGELTATIKQDNKQMAQVIVHSVVAQIKGQPSVKKLLIDGFVIDQANVDKYLK